jgi:peptidoglycan/LPS O-acetylase OafA/YrhL
MVKDSLVHRVDELEGLRAILALWVVTSHMLCWCGFFDQRHTVAFGAVWGTYIDASSAVETFMILSGFAISFLIHHRPQSYAGFLTGRVFRLYPVYLVCLMLGIVSSPLIFFISATATWKTVYFSFFEDHFPKGQLFLAHLIGHLTLLNGVLPVNALRNSDATLLPPAWSISLEWQYYLLAPLIALFVRSGTGLFILILVALLGRHFSAPWINTHGAFCRSVSPFFF